MEQSHQNLCQMDMLAANEECEKYQLFERNEHSISPNHFGQHLIANAENMTTRYRKSMSKLITTSMSDSLGDIVEQKNELTRRIERSCRDLKIKASAAILPVKREKNLKREKSLISRMARRCMKNMIARGNFLVKYFFFVSHVFNALHVFQLRVHLSMYYLMPLNFMSRAWGTFHSVSLPKWMRTPAFRFYVWLFQCDLEAAAVQNLREYKNLSEFFRRKLKPELRPIDPYSDLVSPVDGRIIHCGRVNAGHLEQVKGIKFTMQDFLGPNPYNKSKKSVKRLQPDTKEVPFGRVVLDHRYQHDIKQNKGTELFHCIIYLAPGDYHCFHSPTNWNIHHRRHFPGRLMSVRPSFVQLVPGLFAINERAVYFGAWKYGFFSMTLVGATNVGSIRVLQDKDLQTNVRTKVHRKEQHSDKSFSHGSFMAKKGELFGEFNFGSTAVLIFEAPSTFAFANCPDRRLKFGESLGHWLYAA